MKKSLLLICIVLVNIFVMHSQTTTYKLKSASSGGKFVNSYSNRNVIATKAFKKQSLQEKRVVLHNTKSAKTVVFSETFDNGSHAEGWSTVDNASGGNWIFDNPGGKTINTTTGSDGFAIFDSEFSGDDGQPEDADLISPTIDCSALAHVFFSFEHFFNAGDGDYGEVFVSNDNGSTWTSLDSWSLSSTNNAALASYDITALAAGKSQVKIKWNWKGDNSLFWAIDDILLYEPYMHDLGVTAISPLIAERDSMLAPVVTILNKGISSESTYSVTLSDGNSYNQTVNIDAALDANATYDVEFPEFIAGEKQYNLTATVTLSDDEISENNVLNATLQTYGIRVALASRYIGYSINGLYWLPTDKYTDVGTSEQLQGLAWKDSVLYGITYSGTFGKIDFHNASFVELGTTEISAEFFTSLSYDPVSGKIYASALSGGYPDFTVSLYEMNTTTGIGKFVGSSSTKGTFAYFAFDNSGQFYAIRHIPGENGLLYAVNKNTVEMTEIGDLGGVVSSNFQPLVCDVHENRLYFQASNGGDGNMAGTYLIDTKTAKAQLIGTPYPYQIISMEMPDLDASLMDLRIDGASVENFSPGKYVYRIILPSGTSTIPEVTATAFYPKAAVVVSNSTSLPGNASILVTATDGTKHTYTVQFLVSANTNAGLSDLKVNGTTIGGFSEDKTTYDLTLPSGTSSVPVITATTEDENASASISDAASLPGSTTITVTAADGTTQRTYTINFTLLESTNATLSGLRYNGNSIEGFDPGTYTYDVVLPYGTTIIPYTRATATDPGANVYVINANSLPGSATVRVTAADGITQLIYTINFTVAPASTNASLSDLTVNGTTVTGFNASVYTYDVVLPYGITVVPTVGSTVADNTATKVTTDAQSLPGSTTVMVTAQDGATQLTYTINFTVTPASTNASLSDLTVNGTTVTGFNASVYTYDVVLPYGTTVVPTVGSAIADNTATKVTTDAQSLPGSTTVVVTAQDGTTQLTYTINFTVTPASTNASLSDLTVNGATVTGFSASAYSYDVVLPYGTTVVPTVGSTAADNTATKVTTDAQSLPGSTTVVVTAQDGTTQLTYTIHFTVSTVSGVNESQKNSLKIFPIPANDKMYIESEATIYEVTLIDLNGQKILSNDYDNKEVTINLSGLTTGMYFVGIQTSAGMVYKKVQINR
jgi:hypothetical protein